MKLIILVMNGRYNMSSRKIHFLHHPISAGFPTPAADYTAEPIDLNKYVITNPTATFFARVGGKSMQHAGIQDGAYLVIDKSIPATDNSIVIATIHGDFVVKRLRINGNEMCLESANNTFEPIFLKKEMDFCIWGVVTWVFSPATCLH